MDYVNLIYYQDRNIQFQYSCSDDSSIIFIKCGYCKFTSVFYQSLSKIKININDMVLTVLDEENNNMILSRRLKILDCHKCHTQFSINNNILTIIKEPIQLNSFLPKKEFEKKVEEKKEKEILQEKIIEAIGLSNNDDTIKEKAGNEKADKPKEEPIKKIAFTFVTGGRKKK
jgi:hypothetical protein